MMGDKFLDHTGYASLHVPSVATCLERRVHQYMVPFSHTLVVSLAAWDKANPL